MKAIKKSIYFILLNACWIPQVNAQINEMNYAKDSSKNKELRNITISALTNTAKAPFTKTIYDSASLQTNNTAVDLPILLQNTSNVVTNSDAGTGTGYTGLRLRGTDLTRINVTVNGVPVNDAESQNTYFTDIPDLASSTQGIVIQRGVGSSSNGAGAFGGSININTIQLPKKASLLFSNNFGSLNTIRNTIKLNSGLLRKKFIASARLSRITSDGYVRNSKSNLFGGQFTFAYLPNTNTEVIFNYIKGYEKTGQAWNGVPQDSLITNPTYNELGFVKNGVYYNNQTDNYGQNYFQLIINKKINADWKINITPYLTLGKGYFEEYKLAQNLSEYGLPLYITGNDTIAQTDLIRQLWLNNANLGAIASAIYTQDKYTFTAGFNVSKYTGKHYGKIIDASIPIVPNYKWYNLTSNKKEVSAFAKLEYNATKKLLLFADAQIRLVDYTINGFRKTPTLIQKTKYTFFNPKIGASYAINKNEIAYASVAIANKEPNREDLETNVKPLPEKLINTEIGYGIKVKNGNYKAAFYHMLYKNQLVLNGKINDVGSYTRTNVANSYRAGIELEGMQKIWEQLQLQGNIAFSKNKINKFTTYTDDYDAGNQKVDVYTKTDIAFSPKIVSALGATFYPFYSWNKNKKWSVLVQHKYVSKQFLDNTQSENKSIAAYTFMDATAIFVTKLKSNTTGTFKLGANNVLNARYVNNGYTFSYIAGGLQTFNYYYPQAGRRIWIGIDINL